MIKKFDMNSFYPEEEAYWFASEGEDQIWAQSGTYKDKIVRVYYLLPYEELESVPAEILLETPEDYIYDVDDEF